MLDPLMAAVAKFRQELINEAFSLEDAELAKRINQMNEAALAAILLNYVDFQDAAEMAIYYIQQNTEPDLPF